VVTGHLDSRVTDVLNFTSDAPGADDDASGVALVLELARLFATHRFPGTLVFATVAGEEQGLYGSAYMAAHMKAAGADVQGMFSNDIVGASQAWDGTKPDPHTVRLFVEGIPTAATAAQISLMQSVGGENDGATHQLARFVTDVAPFELTDMNVRVIWRRDRYLRGSDHISFQAQGYPAARFTEPRENFDHPGHSQGQRAVRRPRRGPGRTPQSCRLPAGGRLALPTAHLNVPHRQQLITPSVSVARDNDVIGVMATLLLIHGGLWEDTDADWFWRRPGIIAGLERLGHVVIAPDRLRRAVSWTDEADQIASEMRGAVSAALPASPVTVLGGSFGCAVAVGLALGYPALVGRMMLAWPASLSDQFLAIRIRANLARLGATPRVLNSLLGTATLPSATDAELRGLALPVGVIPSVPPDPVHPRSTVDALLRLLPDATELPGCPEAPSPEFPTHLESFLTTVTTFVGP
jgi:pimeloyl-ACP methyl ester carboxylesterase